MGRLGRASRSRWPPRQGRGVNRELTDEVFPRVVWRGIQELVRVDGVDLPPHAGLVALELGSQV